MREIEFRAYHRLMCCYVDNWNLYGPKIIDGTIDSDNHIVEQYTGLKDKNSVKIFEGDIVSYGDEKAEVKFMVGHFGVTFKDGDWGLSMFTSHEKQAERHFEIIGNIHENPELVN